MGKVFNKELKILTINPGINYCGGVESYIMNYYRNFNHNKIKMDFAVHDVSDKNYINEIEENNDKVYIFKKFNLKNLFRNMKDIKNFFKNHNDYDIVHCNMANASPFYFYYAKKYGIKTRILHSHQTKYANNLSHSMRNIPLIYIGKKLATNFLACSKDAGDFLFKKKKYEIINNAISINKFKYNILVRNEIRGKLNIKSNAVVYGHVGRLELEKNHKFLIEIFSEIKKLQDNVMLLIVGKGSQLEQIKRQITLLNLTKFVIFVNETSLPQNYYQAMDVFIFPSFYEGLGIAAIEAQISGLPLLCNKNLPHDINMNKNICRLSLDETAKEWAKNAIELSKLDRTDNSSNFINTKFDINHETNKLLEYYKTLKE